MSLVVYLALIAAAVVALRHGPGRALLAVYLPVLLLIPDGLRAITPGIPDPNFNQAAILPIVWLAWLRHRAAWRWRAMDGVVGLYALWVALSDYSNRGYADAQNLMFGVLLSVLAPYFVARWVIAAERLDVALAQRIVALVAGVALVGFWEFRFGFNPFRALLAPFFPGQGDGWVTTFRHGVARVAGPYSHAILAGIVMVLAYRLQRWLQWGGHGSQRFARLPGLPISRPALLTALLATGALMTIARGPWVGALVAAAVVAVGRAANRPRALKIAAAGLALAAVVGGLLLADYLAVRPGATMTMSQESALYRKLLFDKYLDIALDHAVLGWGLTTWPKVAGMVSIDNYYLLLSLMHGLPATALLVLLMLGTAAQCVRRGLTEAAGEPSLAFTFAGTLLAIFVALGTVYLGEQVVPLLFLLLGWAQGWLQAGPAGGPVPARQAAADAPRFKHVIC